MHLFAVVPPITPPAAHPDVWAPVLPALTGLALAVITWLTKQIHKQVKSPNGTTTGMGVAKVMSDVAQLNARQTKLERRVSGIEKNIGRRSSDAPTTAPSAAPKKKVGK